MKPHYHRYKGFRRYPGRGGRPVYLFPMSRAEFIERRIAAGLIGGLSTLLLAVILWAVMMA